MRSRTFIFLFLFLFLIPVVSAKDITLSLEQSDYYFKTGEEAIIALETENNYDEEISGMLSYTITQNVNQGNFQYSSSNTKSTSFSIIEDKSEMSLNFGTSDTPMVLDVDLKFSYNDGDSKVVDLDNIKIHFVSEESQKNNQKNQVSGSSQESSQNTGNQNNPFAQQEQRMQQMMDQMMGNQQQNEPQTAEQRLQNNQMSQDSSALKKEMAKQIQEQQQMKEQFQKELSANDDFQKEHQDLLDKGYNLTNGEINPSSNNTGSFELQYEKPSGEKASLKGQMNDGSMQNLQKDTAEGRKEILDMLKENKKFQDYQEQLQNKGYSQENVEFSQENNKTEVKLNYQNPENETASITADIINDTVKNVELKKEDEESKSYWWALPIILLLIIIGYLVYKITTKKQVPDIKVTETKILKPFDYKKESLRLLNASSKLFEKKDYKDAYGTAGQALRLFLSYDNRLNKEITNDKIIRFLKANKKEFKKAKECFDLCSLVEFAKYNANKKDFDRITKIIIEIIS